MTYLQTHKRPYQRLKQVIVGAVFAFIVLVGLTQLFAPHAFPALFTAIARPFWRLEFSVASGGLTSPEALLQEKEVVSRQLMEAQIRLETIKAIELENNELKTLLGRSAILPAHASTSPASGFIVPQKKEAVGILAAVLKRPPLSLYDELIIDIGRDYGISTSSFVYVSGNVLIGHVVDVLGTTAKVRLFSSPTESYPIVIGATRTTATAIGRGGGQYEAQVSRDTPVAEGDFVLSAGFNDRPFGIVSAILLDPTRAFKTVLFAPPTNIYQLRWVLVKKRE